MRIFRVQAEVLLLWQVEGHTEEQRLEIDTRLTAAEVAAALGIAEAEVRERQVLEYVISQQPEEAEVTVIGSAHELSIAELLEMAEQPSLFDQVPE